MTLILINVYMNYKRAIVFGLMLWLAIFIVLSLLMFIPVLKESNWAVNIVFWILLVPMVLLLSKWYFKQEPPTVKKGLVLGIIALSVSIVLDILITVPFFVGSFAVFFGDWMLWAAMFEILLLTVFAGMEFDATFSKKEGTAVDIEDKKVDSKI